MANSRATRHIHQNALRPSLFIYSCPTVYTTPKSRPRSPTTRKMNQSSTPFLSRNPEKDREEEDEAENDSTTDVDLEDAITTTTSQKTPRRQHRKSSSFFRRLLSRSCPDLILYLFALWGFLSLIIQLAQLLLPITPIFPSYHHQPQGQSTTTTTTTTRKDIDIYRPSTYPSPSYDLCSCGSSVHEAQSLSCVYDTMAAAWLPPHCRDPELTSNFDHSGPGDGGSWHYYADKNGSVRLNAQQISLLADNPKGDNVFWATREWHLAHCLFYWQKLVRMRDTNAVMERRFDGWSHAKHCYGLLMRRDPPPRDMLLEVDVRLSSGFEMGTGEGHEGEGHEGVHELHEGHGGH